MALLRASANDEDSIGFAAALNTFGTWAAIFFVLLRVSRSDSADGARLRPGMLR